MQALQAQEAQGAQEARCKGGGGMDLDNGDDEARDVGEFCHVDGEVLQLVLLGLVQHQARAVAHGVDAPQVGSGVEGRVGGARQRDFGEAGGPRTVGGRGARGAQRAIGRVGLAAAGRDGGLGALAVEQTHGGQEQTAAGRRGGEEEGRLAGAGGRSRLAGWRRSSRERAERTEGRRQRAEGSGQRERSRTGTVCRGRTRAIHGSAPGQFARQNEPRSSWRSWRRACAGPLSCLSAGGSRGLGARGLCWDCATVGDVTVAGCWSRVRCCRLCTALGSLGESSARSRATSDDDDGRRHGGCLHCTALHCCRRVSRGAQHQTHQTHQTQYTAIRPHGQTARQLDRQPDS